MAPAHYKRTAHRGKLLALMLSALFFAFGSFWLLQIMSSDGGGGPVNVGNDPDYIVENFSFVRMAETGKPRYVISGERLTHRPADNSSVIEKPVVQGLNTEHPPMTMTAQHALVSQNQNQVDLSGDVDIQRPGAANARPLRVRTQALTFLPDEDIAKTDRAIEMKVGTATAHGVGMVANNATQQVELGGRGKIVFPPRSAR
ncbi:LPS export ABC transporter periplasmic protein LptC [Herbaspirillum sp. SJZ107]|uniref:LPS export ABC transporter periplasmic protein LptC n=1 Tax=Herbaspirillum sp. SJZ107 TaxID=2572881 RepID=UPI00114F3E31|nr:LPS export ABC transporter periplasmic protein LptC [Herbaspirillum sp. SJZ107]TQK04918.1 lipopolysaccharide export system protein LptC [Herbaspirillum sp. SJZ107]